MKLRFIQGLLLCGLVILNILFMSCATYQYTAFQDGKTIGEGNYDLVGGLTFGPSYSFMNTDLTSMDYKLNSAIAPLFSIESRRGLQDNLDLGARGGIDFELAHIRLFGKLSLLDQHEYPRLGIAILPSINYGFNHPEKKNDIDEYDKLIKNISYIKFHLSTPVSYRITNNLVISASPIVGWEKYMVEHYRVVKTILRDSIVFHSWGLSFGLKYKVKKESAKGYIFPELAIIYNDYTREYHPYFGVGFGGK